MRVFAPFHQAGGDQLVQHAHQGRAFHAQRLGQRALAHTIAQAAGEDDGPGGGLGQAVVGQRLVGGAAIARDSTMRFAVVAMSRSRKACS